MGLIGVGFGLLLGAIFGFVLKNVGPSSDLWWADRPFRLPRTRVWLMMSAVGIALIVLGGLVAH
ncbi:MAG TPA: hypothetical protein VL856_14865 [Acidimicrobiia bacterium]|nr:hypothetical protein [Acidimicrobiia bacterium]